jgi:hypothetical protein
VLRDRVHGRRASALVVVAVLCTACGITTRPAGFVFSAAIEGDVNVPRVLWLERADLAVPTQVDEELVEIAFTYNLARLLRQKKIFSAVKIYERTAGPDDWVARVRIDRAIERGRVPLSTIVGSAFTFGLYTAFGRLQELEFEMVGRLEIRDARGQEIGGSDAIRASTLSVYRKNLTNAFSFFMDERTRFVDELLEKALTSTGAREP